MDKKKLNEQFEKLDIDMAEELEARIETRGWRPGRSSYSNDQLSTSHAIIIGAIIIVVGLWGGKLAYDYHQEQKLKRALGTIVNTMNKSLEEADESLARTFEQQRVRQQEQARIQQRQAQQRARIIADERAQQARAERLASDQCRFWRDQIKANASERNLEMERRSCN